MSRCAPGKWNAQQILAHLAEADMLAYTRVHQAIVKPGDSLFPIADDGERWMQVLAGNRRTASVSLAAISGARLGIAETLRLVPEERLRRRLRHEQLGEVTPLFSAQVCANHGLHHLRQLEALRDASKQ